MSNSGSTGYASRTGRRPRTDGYVRGRQSNGYRFGSARFETSASAPETNLAIIVPGQSLTRAGFELLDAAGAMVAWYECILDAVDALKVYRGAGKVVRCLDRALMKIRHPHRGRP